MQFMTGTFPQRSPQAANWPSQCGSKRFLSFFHHFSDVTRHHLRSCLEKPPEKVVVVALGSEVGFRFFASIFNASHGGFSAPSFFFLHLIWDVPRMQLTPTFPSWGQGNFAVFIGTENALTFTFLPKIHVQALMTRAVDNTRMRSLRSPVPNSTVGNKLSKRWQTAKRA